MLSSTAIPRDTNESKTAYDLVRRLVLKGKRIVAVAAYCQRDICETIVEKEADYLVTVKQNQRQLLQDIEQAFVISRSWQDRFVTPRDLVRNSIVIAQFDVTDNLPSAAPPTPYVKPKPTCKPPRPKEKSRGRIETRTVTTTIDEQHLDWPGAKQLICLERHTVEKGQTRQSVTYAITSLSREQADAAFLLNHLRGRWQIENRCFYVLDTSLGDDASRTGHAAHALTSIRLATLNLARRLRQTVGSLCREHARQTPPLDAQTPHLQKLACRVAFTTAP